MHAIEIGTAGLVIFLLASACTPENPRPPLSVPAPPRAPTAKSVDSSVVTSSGDSSVVSPAVVTASSSDCAPQVGNVAALDSAEKKAISGSEGKAVRLCHELTIRLANGRTVTFTDNTTDHFLLPRYEGYLKAIRSHVVHGVPMEGTGYYMLLDDSTGDSTIVYGVPVPSPDGKRFVVTSMVDAGAGYDPGLIEVWRMVGRKPEKEFEFSTEEQPWQPSQPVWRDSTTIEFMKNVFTSFTTPDIQTRARLIRSGTGWVFADSLSGPQ